MLILLLGCTPDYDHFGPEGAEPVILMQGGKVDRERYHWLAEELGDAGYSVLVPQYRRDLAIMNGERTHRTLEEAREFGLVDDTKAVLIGHSLGGAVASYQWVEYPEDYAELVLLASWPSQGLDVSRDERVLELVGSEDGEPLSAFIENTTGFVDLECHVIDGMTHYDWTDGTTDRELEKQGTVATRPMDETRAEAVDLLLDFLARR
jgi:pimeloyl-ACP methyl ester carboxylesterase